VMEAKRRGAKAVVLAQHPTSSEAMIAFGEGGGAEARIPALHLSAAKAEELLPGYGMRVAALDEGQAAAGVGERTVALTADVVRARGTAQNVLARLRGEDSTRVLLVGAHFDHLGRGGAGSLAPDKQGEIHNGADDNASGTAVVLELARCLAAAPKPACDVVLALWSGEELGLLGSEHWARNPSFPLASVIANVNLDMVGRADSNPVAVLGAGSAAAFAPILAQVGPRAGFELSVSLSGQGVGGSDHQTFLKREIPALHVFTGLHADYHRPSDDHERFEAEGAEKVTNLVLDLVDALPRQTLAFVPAPKETTPNQAAGGFKTRFGSIPDYAFPGPGMRLDGTSPGGPAEKAGLLRGDVLLGIGDTAVEGIGDFMFVLNTHKPGDVLTVRFLRDGTEERAQVTLESNQVE
ncbi:MAG: M28 family peptidase, partial [Planctomycetota bacterium]